MGRLQLSGTERNEQREGRRKGNREKKKKRRAEKGTVLGAEHILMVKTES